LRTVVGLDIGGSGVRAAEIVVGRSLTLRRFASVPLPDGVVTDGLVTDGDALADALRDLWALGKFSTRDVAFAIANNGVLVRQMDLLWMPPADFRKALRYQVADALPVPVDEANLDYYLLDEIESQPENPDAQSKVARVMLVAAGREMVDGFVNAIEKAGLRAIRVDLLPFALVRAISDVGEPDAPLEAIVDIGADKVVVVVHQAGRPRFVRTLDGRGGKTITRALMERYDWTWDEAERSKVVLGLVGSAPPVSHLDDESPSGTGAPDAAPHPAHRVMAEHVDALVTDLNDTLDYFRSSAGDQGALARLVLTGGAAGLGGLAEALEGQLEIPVVRFSAFERLARPRRAVVLEDEEASLTVPTGLCLGSAS